MLWLKQDGITGGGYGTLSLALTGSLTVKVLLGLCVLKLAATVFSYSSGGVGGIFAPSLFIGGMLGGAVGYLDVAVFHHPPDVIGAFALVGMGATFAGIIRAPMTSVLIIFEMTGSYGLILPLMIANMIAYALARHWRHTTAYEALLLQDGVVLPHGKPATNVESEAILPSETPP
jgi:CIC family chloride channel protein